MQQPLLAFNNVEISYDDEAMIQGVSLKMNKGEILGIVGESGSGKSTLIKASMGLLGRSGRVSQGEILYQGQNVLNLGDEAFRNLRGPKMGMIFQNCGSALCPIRTIGDQLCEAMKEHGQTDRQAIKDEALAMFDRIHLHDGDRILNSYPFELSGGMNQRVGIVMAMILKPDLLFADEPTSALDVTVQAQVVKEMMALRETFGMSIVIVTHNIGVVSYMADNVAVMCKGRLVEYGKTRDVIDHPIKDYTRQLIGAVPRIRRG
ncbi:MAG: ABC transporter ATP-binding protein [Eubacteriaceae bacterium]|jgi:ABC-type dipeptide/oligopeptide/nickel transport system ATPase component